MWFGKSVLFFLVQDIVGEGRGRLGDVTRGVRKCGKI